MDKVIFDYIIAEEAAFKTTRIPITSSVEWNMHEHIERCTNVSKGWFHKGKNDGMRPYKDIVTPIMNVALRSEGFDVKDIVPYVDDIEKAYKSFLVKKYHQKWARKYEIDTFIDEVVESSVVYDLVIVKDVNNVRPVVVKLQEIAFCDQTNFLSGPQAFKHQYTIPEMLAEKGWYPDKVDEAITMAKAEKSVSQSNDQQAKTPGKYVTVYELHGTFPETWLDVDGDPNKYIPQLHILTYYTSTDGTKNPICLFKGPERKPVFKTLVINSVFGRACGKSLIETLFDPQVWTNYDAIRIKEILDAAALVLFQSSGDDVANQKLTNLKTNTILKYQDGHPITKIDTTVPNMPAFTNHQAQLEVDARTLGSASEAQLGKSPVSGTPFALQALVVQEGQGIHEYRQGKIATFFADQLYPDWIIKYLVNDMNGGKKFSEELSLDELQEIAEITAKNIIDKKIKDQILEGGDVPTEEDREEMLDLYKKNFMKQGKRVFFEALKDELKDIPVDVYVNIKGKQRYMAQNADKITNVIRAVMANPEGFKSIPGVGKAFNELLEESGMSPIDFTPITKPVVQQAQTLSPVQPPVEEQLQA